ncbi:MAG: hypothetical protein C4338_03060 [Rhodanobacteraceae bacterium]
MSVDGIDRPTYKFVDGPPLETDEMGNMDDLAIGDSAVEAPDAGPGSESFLGIRRVRSLV